MLVVGPYRFLKNMNNSGLIVEVENKTGTMQKVSSFYLLPYFSAPEQV